jgi:hypothetical protein
MEIRFEDYSPVIIGGIGGSGTRLISDLCTDLGIYMGSELNESSDTMHFVDFYDEWINKWYDFRSRPFSLSSMREHFRQCFIEYLKKCNSDCIGWKNPRSVHLVDFFHGLFPGMKFIHVVRDGRDVAFSKTQIQVERHGRAILGDLAVKVSKPVASALIWQTCNTWVREYCEMNLKEGYLVVKYEDICKDVRNEFERVTRFVGKKAGMSILNSHAKSVEDFLQKRSTIGRYQNEDPFTLSIIQTEIGIGLKDYGYLS